MRFDPIPQARVVRKGGQLVAPPRAPRSEPERTLTSHHVRTHLRSALEIVVGLWPLTAVILLMAGLIIMAGNATYPAH